MTTAFEVKARRDEYKQVFLEAWRGTTQIGFAEGYPGLDGDLFLKYFEIFGRYRRKGYGRTMAARLEGFARSWGYGSITLKPNDLRSAQFWTAMGYTLNPDDPFRQWQKDLR